MTLDTARDAIAARLKTDLLALRPSALIVWPNQPKAATPPASSDTWFRVSFQPLRTEQPAVSDPTYIRDFAQVAVEIFTPPGKGDDALYTAEAQVRGIFAGLTVSGAKFSTTRSTAPRFVLVGLVDDLGVWFKGMVIAPFQFDYAI